MINVELHNHHIFKPPHTKSICQFFSIFSVKRFEKNGWWLLREGAKHTIYTNGKDCESVSRQKEIDEKLARKIISRRDLD